MRLITNSRHGLLSVLFLLIGAVSPAAADILVNPSQISAREVHTCALDDNGVQCWGSNGEGQITVPSLSNPTQVSGGGYHTCALDDNGVQCWGSNSSAQITVPSLINPSQINSLSEQPQPNQYQL